jgi:hypothetical protein
MRFDPRIHLLFLASLATTPACGPRSEAPSIPRPSRGAFDVITREEITARAWSSAHDLVSTLRPQWMRVRGPDSLNGTATPVQAYLDGIRLNGIIALAEISTAGIIAVEFVDGVEAAARWGLNHSQGAIVVRTRKP